MEFSKQDNLCSKFIWKTYIAAQHPSQVMEKKHSSPHWKRLVAGRKKAQGHIFWILGEGKKSFWMDKWIGQNTMKEMCDSDTDGNKEVQCWKTWSNGNWDTIEIGDMNIPNNMKDQILNFPIIQGKDKICWMLSQDENFTTKSA